MKSGVISRRPGDKPEKMLTARVHLLFAIFLAALAVVAGYLQYFSQPAQCWCPAFFSGSMAWYTNSRCFFGDTYYLLGNIGPVPEPLPTEALTNYFKWTPFGLLFLAALYIIPELTVRVCSAKFPSTINRVLHLADQCKGDNSYTRDAAIKHLTAELKSRLEKNASRSKFRQWISWFVPSLPDYIWLKYFSSKLVYVVGSIIPVVFLYHIVQPSSIFQDNPLSVGNTTGQNHSYFPKEILCDFSIVHIQSIQRFTVQCHLSANDMFERMSRLVAFLALVVSTVGSSDVISCLVTRLFEQRSSAYVKKHMKLFSSGCDLEICREFLESYLREDGMYLIHLIGENSSEAVIDQILSELWEGNKMRSFEKDPILLPQCLTMKSLLVENAEIPQQG